MNLIVLMGRLVRDPELKYTPQGTPVASFTLAVDRDFKNAHGEKETDFIYCLAWRKTGETIAQYLRKGRRMTVEGRLQVRSYETNDGQKRTVSEVIVNQFHFVDFGKKSETASSTPDVPPPLPDEEAMSVPDDLPF